MNEAPRHWRLNGKYIRFEGDVCPTCNKIHFYPCPNCQKLKPAPTPVQLVSQKPL